MKICFDSTNEGVLKNLSIYSLKLKIIKTEIEWKGRRHAVVSEFWRTLQVNAPRPSIALKVQITAVRKRTTAWT